MAQESPQNFKLTVITASYNAGSSLIATIESVLACQEYCAMEHIIMDGGSKDSTLSTLKSYPHLIWKSEPDKGIYDALNKCLKLATGTVVLTLQAGDTLISTCIKDIVEFYKRHQTLPILTGSIIKGDITNRFFAPVHQKAISEATLNQAVQFNHQATFIPLKYHKLYGDYTLEYKIAGDYELLLRFALKHKVPVVSTHDIISHMQGGGMSARLSIQPLIHKEIISILTKYAPTCDKIQLKQYYKRAYARSYLLRLLPYRIRFAIRNRVNKPFLPKIKDL